MNKTLSAWRQLRRHKEASSATDKPHDRATSPPANEEGLFDIMLQRQTAHLQQRQSLMRRFTRRPSDLVPDQSTAPAKPGPSAVSRDLARAFLLSDEDKF
jgi:hypothetical protein